MVRRVVGAQHAFLLLSCAVAYRPGGYPEELKIWVQDMGMYGSGTNLLYETIQWSYPLCGTNPSKPELDKIALESDEYCVKFCGLHKHVNPNLVLQAVQGQPSKFFLPLRDEISRRGEVVVLAIIRDPLAQINSWKRNP